MVRFSYKCKDCNDGKDSNNKITDNNDFKVLKSLIKPGHVENNGQDFKTQDGTQQMGMAQPDDNQVIENDRDQARKTPQEDQFPECLAVNLPGFILQVGNLPLSVEIDAKIRKG